MNLRVGTSGYNFPEWKGTFYPAKMPEAKMLEYYAQRLSTVEINYTFYRMPNAKTVAGWDAATPAGFTFVLKAPQRITHHYLLEPRAARHGRAQVPRLARGRPQPQEEQSLPRPALDA